MSPSRPVRLVTAAALAALAPALLAGCGAAAPSKAAAGGTPPATGPAATTAPSRSATTSRAAGTWTAAVRLAGPVSDGRLVVGGKISDTGGPEDTVALDAGTGRTRWSVPADPDAVHAGPTRLFAPGRPLVQSVQVDTPGSGLTPASSGWQVTRLDPATGRTLWTATTTGPAVAAGDAVLAQVREGISDAAVGTLALDPADGHQLWTSGSVPVLLDGGTAVLAPNGDDLNRLLVGVDPVTGNRRWDSSTWTTGTLATGAGALAAAHGHLLVTEGGSDLTGSTHGDLRVRDIANGLAVGDSLPVPRIPGALVDTTDAVAVVYEKQDQGADTGVYAVDMTTGTVLWKLAAAQSTAAYAAGGGVAWIGGADGIVAVDDRTGAVRQHALVQPPELVLDHAQLVDDGPGLRSAPLPR